MSNQASVDEAVTNLKSPNGRRSFVAVDIALELNQKGLLGFFMDIWETYGDLAKLQMGPIQMYVVVHPDHVRQIMVTNASNYVKGKTYNTIRKLLLGNGLLTSTGAQWQQQRRLMAPFFTPVGIERFADTIISVANDVADRWEHLAQTGETVEMLDEMMSATATIILKSLFSTLSDDDIRQLRYHIEAMVAFTVNRTFSPVALPVWVPVSSHQEYKKARKAVLEYVESIIAGRYAMDRADWPDDFLSSLMNATDEETGQPISEELLRDEVITFFVAGHETTAHTLSFLWYLLSEHPAVMAKLKAEIDRVAPDNEPLTLDHFKQLSYTLAVIKETLRLYPASPVYARDVVATDNLGGYKIEAGASVTLFPYASHRHPDYWEAPLAFNPDRWLQPSVPAHNYAYHPFSAGQRICIGNNLSLLESQILVGVLARRFAPTLIDGHIPEPLVRGTLTSKNGMPMSIQKLH